MTLSRLIAAAAMLAAPLLASADEPKAYHVYFGCNTPKGSTSKGIVELKGEELKMCYDSTGSGDRPTKFDGEKNHLFVLKKKKADK
jgi:uncharacterized protein (TIGR03067 family)